MYPREVYVNIMASFIKYSFKYTVSLKNMDARLPGWKNVKTHYLTCLKIATIVLVIFSYTTASAAEKTTISYGVSLLHSRVLLAFLLQYALLQLLPPLHLTPSNAKSHLVHNLLPSRVTQVAVRTRLYPRSDKCFGTCV